MTDHIKECNAFESQHPGATYINDVWGYPVGIMGVRRYPQYPWRPLVPAPLSQPMASPDFPAILEAARLGVCNEEIQAELDISEEEAARLHSVIVELQTFGSEL